MRRRFAHAAMVTVALVAVALLAFAPSRAQTVDLGRVVVNTSLLNVRSGPGTQFLVLGVVSGGTELPVTGVTSDGRWWQVDTSFGSGFVFADFVVYRGGAAGLIPVVTASEAAPTAPPTAVVLVPALNVRSGPGINFSVLGVVQQASVLPVTGRSSETGWYQVDSPFGAGWVAPEAVTLTGDTSGIPAVDGGQGPLVGPIAVVNVSRLNVRSGPGGHFTILGVVTGGTELLVTGRFSDGKWWEVVSPFDGGKAYVSGDFVVLRGDASGVPLLSYSDFPATSAAPASASATPSGPLTGPHVVVNTSMLNVRSGPGGHFSILGVVTGGTELAVTGRFSDGKWWEVVSPFDGGKAYVSGDFVVFRGSTVGVPLLSYSDFPGF